MSGAFDVEPDELLTAARQLRQEATSLDDDAGRLPEVDAGVMSGEMESGVGAILCVTAHIATVLDELAAELEITALDYHHTDVERAEDLARLLLPGADREQVARTVREQVVGRAALWRRVDARADTRSEKLRDFWTVSPDPQGH